VDIGDRELEEIIDLLRKGQSLPSRYRATLFEDASQIELIWPGKTGETERVVLPFQSIEHIDEPRSGTARQQDLFTVDSVSGRQRGGWTNKLIWGDNKLVLSSLVSGPMRDEIEGAGGLKLVYIDPPFDVGMDFSVDVEVGEETVTKAMSVIEERAFRDTWGDGMDSYVSMMWERLSLLRSLMAPGGAIYVHCDWRVSPHLRFVLDENFGRESFLNEIVWEYSAGAVGNSSFGRKHDTILRYGVPGETLTFNADDVRIPYAESTLSRLNYAGAREKDIDKVLTRGGKVPTDVWQFSIVQGNALEATGYPTQKPEALLERIIKASSNEGDLVADFFCGSGTTLAVAERLGRKWIGVDLGRFAIHETRKRMISVQRRLALDSQPYRAFEILNLGSYERQYFVGVDMTLPEDQRAAESDLRREEFLSLILGAYGAQRSEQLPEFQGVKGGSAVLVGPIDSPVTSDQINRATQAAISAGLTRVDVLGFEFEMGIKPVMADEAREQGVTLTLRYIPNDVFDKRAIASGQVKFLDVGYVEIETKVAKDRSLTVELKDFGVFYAQEDAEAVTADLRSGKSRVLVDGGQVVRVSKDKNGVVGREVLTESWSDWIDYWTVDFDFESQREVIGIVEDGEAKNVWTGRYIFENEWQDFRTRGNRSLRLSSGPHTYEAAGGYRVAVKVIDVFGNDTTKVVSVVVT
jgi:DNA modification methylase